MSINTITTTNIKSSDSKGGASIEYNAASRLQTAPITIRWAGNSLSFNSVVEFQNYVDEVLFPTISKVFNTDGLGTGGTTLPDNYIPSSSTMVN